MNSNLIKFVLVAVNRSAFRYLAPTIMPFYLSRWIFNSIPSDMPISVEATKSMLGFVHLAISVNYIMGFSVFSGLAAALGISLFKKTGFVVSRFKQNLYDVTPMALNLSTFLFGLLVAPVSILVGMKFGLGKSAPEVLNYSVLMLIEIYIIGFFLQYLAVKCESRDSISRSFRGDEIEPT